MTSKHNTYMAKALAQAKCALPIAKPNPAVGCIIVANNTIVGAGHTQPVGHAHAEVMALAQAGVQAQGATAYVTLEPCAHFGHTPPCSQALIDGGIAQVVYGTQDPNPQVNGNGLTQLINAGIKVIGPIMETECRALNASFFHAIHHQSPFVFSKLACSLDGRTAMASGESKWLTGYSARAQVHLLRAQSCALVTGVGTILADDPSLTCRTEALLSAGMPTHLLDLVKQPMRVIIDSQLRTPTQANIFTCADITKAPVWIITCSQSSSRKKVLEQQGATVFCIPSFDNQVDLKATIALLQQHHCQQIMIEAGAKLNAGFMQHNLIHRIELFMAPKLLGSTAKPLLDVPIERLSDAWQLAWQQHQMVGADLHLSLSL